MGDLSVHDVPHDVVCEEVAATTEQQRLDGLVGISEFLPLLRGIM